MELLPITLHAANAFVRAHHRHLPSVRGCVFCLSAFADGETVGVLVAGRPIARANHDGFTCEVTRCCTLGYPNVNSFLYGAAAKAARALGYRRLITYTLPSEGGASLRAAGWRNTGPTRAHSWSHAGRPRPNSAPPCVKLVWERYVEKVLAC